MMCWNILTMFIIVLEVFCFMTIHWIGAYNLKWIEVLDK